MAVEYLINKGYRKIAFVGGLADISSNQERFQGYKEALETAGLELHQDYIVGGDFKREGGHQATKGLLQLEPPPDAIFAANDRLALGAIQAIREQEIRIPEDIAVMGLMILNLPRCRRSS
jgi:LacI family transcriptional regulator